MQPSWSTFQRSAASDPALSACRRPAASLAGLSSQAIPLQRSVLQFEEELRKQGFKAVAGTDEAGRGPLAGPVVAAAVMVLDLVDKEVFELLSTLKDSKKMTRLRREKAYSELIDLKDAGRIAWEIAEVQVGVIDEYNILQASLYAMTQAVLKLPQLPDCVLVDGNSRPPGLLKPGEIWTSGRRSVEPRKEDGKLPDRVDAIVGGDGKVCSIAAASVLAKVHRDDLMVKIGEQYPEYNFAQHKGYGTKAHMEALKLHGACPQHRGSFAPVRASPGDSERMGASAAGKLAPKECEPPGGLQRGATATGQQKRTHASGTGRDG